MLPFFFFSEMSQKLSYQLPRNDVFIFPRGLNVMTDGDPLTLTFLYLACEISYARINIRYGQSYFPEEC